MPKTRDFSITFLGKTYWNNFAKKGVACTLRRLWRLSRGTHPKQFYSIDESSSKLSLTAKRLEKIDLHLKSILARLPFYNQAYPHNLPTASPGISLAVTNPTLLELDEMSLEKSKSLMETYFSQFSAINSWKVFWESKLASKSTSGQIAYSSPLWRR